MLEIHTHDSRTCLWSARVLFAAVKESLTSEFLDYSRCIAFMSDTINVIKGARSRVQRLLRNECPHVLDVGCICHLADLTDYRPLCVM